jgi:hypothetical protein
MHLLAITVTLLSAALIIGCDGAGPDLVPGADADVMLPSPDGGVSPDAGAREDQGAVAWTSAAHPSTSAPTSAT